VEQGTLVGVIVCFVGVFGAVILKGISPTYLFTIPAAFLVVLVGAMGATFTSNEMKDNKRIGKIIGKAFKAPSSGAHDPAEVVGQVVGFADRARREGLLALEEDCQKIEDEFLQKGLQMAIDGTDPEQVRDTLSLEIKAMKERHKTGAAMMTQLGVFCPSFGIIGAVLGLIATMGHMDDPEMMAHGISAAFVATFWGVFFANGVFLPFGHKLKKLSEEEVHHKTLLLEGIMSIQAGANPRVVEETMLAFLPPAVRLSVIEERKSA
jgi:chemotaxis protein MotA